MGESIARAIRELLTHGRLPMLDPLRGEADPMVLLASVPGIGRVLAERLHDALVSRRWRISKPQPTMAAWRPSPDSAPNDCLASAIRSRTGSGV